MERGDVEFLTKITNFAQNDRSMSEEFSKKYYKISEVAELLGLSTPTLRFWEKKFTILKPKRNQHGVRLYTPEDIETIRLVLFLVKQKGLKIEAAQQEIRVNRKNVSQRAEIIQRLTAVRDKLKELQQAFAAVRYQ